jgi:hypothetical protein
VYFTAHSEDGSSLKTRSEFWVRYNRRLAAIGFGEQYPVNQNPAVSWVGVYTVRGAKTVFDPAHASPSDSFTFQYLYNSHDPSSVRDTIAVDTGYSYFLAADSGFMAIVDNEGDTVIDTTRDRVPHSSSHVLEDNDYVWFYQNVGAQAEDPDSLIYVGSWRHAAVVQLLPPLKTSMDHFKVWVTVHDDILGALWPRCTTVRQAAAWFSYSDAYRSKYQQ